MCFRFDFYGEIDQSASLEAPNVRSLSDLTLVSWFYDELVLIKSLMDDGFDLSGCYKPFRFEDFATEPTVKELALTILPRAVWIEVNRLDADFDQPSF